MSGRLSRAEGWEGAPDDPPTVAPQLQVEISDDRLRLVEDGDAWISAEAALALEDCR